MVQGTKYNTNDGSVIAYTDTLHILYISRDTGGGYGVPERVGGALSSNQTAMRPMVAVGNGKIVVQWVTMDDLSCEAPPLETCVKTISTGTWSCNQKLCNGSGTSRSEQAYQFGLTFDAPGADFIGSKTDDTAKRLIGFVVDTSTGNQADSEFFGTSWLRNLTKSACEPMDFGADTTVCYAVGMRDSSFRLRMHTFTMNSHVIIEGSSNTKLHPGHYGANDMAYGDNAVFVLTRGDNGPSGTVYRIDGYPYEGSDFETLTTNYCPIAVGGIRTWVLNPLPTYSTKFRIVWAP